MTAKYQPRPFTPHPFHWGIWDTDKKAWVKDNWGLVMLWHENQAKAIAKEIEQKMLESIAISMSEIFWDCRNSAIAYRKPITAKTLRRIQNKRRKESRI